MKKFIWLLLAYVSLAITLFLNSCEPEEVKPKLLAQATSIQNGELTGFHHYFLVKRNNHTVEYNVGN